MITFTFWYLCLSSIVELKRILSFKLSCCCLCMLTFDTSTKSIVQVSYVLNSSCETYCTPSVGYLTLTLINLMTAWTTEHSWTFSQADSWINNTAPMYAHNFFLQMWCQIIFPSIQKHYCLNYSYIR